MGLLVIDQEKCKVREAPALIVASAPRQGPGDLLGRTGPGSDTFLSAAQKRVGVAGRASAPLPHDAGLSQTEVFSPARTPGPQDYLEVSLGAYFR
jgi:hypothetical protein